MKGSLEIEDLEFGIAPCGASDAVSGPACVVVIAVIAVVVYTMPSEVTG